CALQRTKGVQCYPWIRASYLAKTDVNRWNLRYASTLGVYLSGIKPLVSDLAPLACCHVLRKVSPQSPDIRCLQWPCSASQPLRQQELSCVIHPLIATL